LRPEPLPTRMRATSRRSWRSFAYRPGLMGITAKNRPPTAATA